jgi:hypothetical protein
VIGIYLIWLSSLLKMAITLVAASSRWINIGDAVASLKNVAAATGCVWAKPTSLVSSGSRGLIGFSTGTSNTIARFTIEQISGDWQGVARRLDADGASIAAGGTPAVGTLVHVVVVANYAGGHIKLYLDGQIITTTNVGSWTANTSNTNSNKASLGAEEDGGSSYFDGTIDDARVYTRALSAQEIENMFYSRGSDTIVYGLLHRWKMNESYPGATASGTSTVKDTAGTINITPTNSPVYAEGLCRTRHRRC